MVAADSCDLRRRAGRAGQGALRRSGLPQAHGDRRSARGAQARTLIQHGLGWTKPARHRDRLPGARAGSARPQAARGYPDRAITIIVPAPVGGATDLLARIIGGSLRRILGQPSVVDNRPGAIGSIGAAAVARAEPNGYTVLCTPNAPVVLSPLVNRNLPYDAAALEPIISLAQSFFVVAVRKDFPANSISS